MTSWYGTEPLSTLLVIYGGVQWTPVDSPLKGPLMRSFDVSSRDSLNMFFNT